MIKIENKEDLEWKDLPTVNKACKFLNKKSACTISSCCLGKYKTAYGFKWKYLD